MNRHFPFKRVNLVWAKKPLKSFETKKEQKPKSWVNLLAWGLSTPFNLLTKMELACWVID